MDADERGLLRDSLAQTVKAAGPDGLRAAVRGFGWFDLLAEDPATAVATLATLQGEHLTDTTLVDDVVLAAAGLDGPARVVYPDPPHGDPTSRLDGDVLAVDGVLNRGDGERLVVPALRRGAVTVVLLDRVPPDGVVPDGPGGGLDPASGWRRARIDLDVSGAEVLQGAAAVAAWSAMRAAGHRALAHELTAVGSRMLVCAVDHVTTREQFGRKLAGFQAVKHALADVRVWQECAELAAEAAWEDHSPDSARIAKVLAGRFVRTAAANCQQVLGGMGFTWEHEFHRLLRRVLVLEPLLGSAARLRVTLGSQLRAEGVPRLAEL